MNDNKQNLMENARDEDLKNIMGDRYKDLSNITSDRNTLERLRPVKMQADSKQSKAEDTSLHEVPTYAPNWLSKLKGCVRHALLCRLLVALFGYWHISAQMDASAVDPLHGGLRYHRRIQDRQCLPGVTKWPSARIIKTGASGIGEGMIHREMKEAGKN